MPLLSGKNKMQNGTHGMTSFLYIDVHTNIPIIPDP